MNITGQTISPAYSVLIVDDEELGRDLLARRLINDGYSVTTAINGEAATSLMVVERFDLILLDINMPVMNGFEVLEWLRNRDKQSMRAIMLTGDGDRDSVTASLTLGADDYLLKTAGIVEILHRVRRACQDAALEAQQDLTSAPAECQDCHVLVVDDESLNQDIIMRRLQRLNFTTHAANDGHAALRLLEQKHMDLMFLDYLMPALDGLEVLNKVRQRWHGDELGIIMISAESEPALVTQFYEAGADDYIAKPFHAAELLARTQNALLDLRLRQKARRLADLAGLGGHIRSTGA
jgi:DNA-binding response OmpR family regulator